MAVNKRAAGADKEQLAARYLVDNGYTVLERNFRNKTGEIDIICLLYTSDAADEL